MVLSRKRSWWTTKCLAEPQSAHEAHRQGLQPEEQFMQSWSHVVCGTGGCVLVYRAAVRLDQSSFCPLLTAELAWQKRKQLVAQEDADAALARKLNTVRSTDHDAEDSRTSRNVRNSMCGSGHT